MATTRLASLPGAVSPRQPGASKTGGVAGPTQPSPALTPLSFLPQLTQ